MATPADKRNLAVPAATLAIIAAVFTIGLVVIANVTRERIARSSASVSAGLAIHPPIV